MAKRKRPDVIDDAVIESLIAEQETFIRDGWKRTRHGSLRRVWEDKTLTVFAREDDGETELFGWCIADSEERYYSARGYTSEEKAKQSLAREIRVGCL